MAFDSGKTGAQVLAGLMPTGGTAGQALRKVDGTDGNAAWSSHWVVDPTTGAMSSTLPDDVTPIDLFDTEAPMLLSATSTLTAAVKGPATPPGTLDTIFKVTKASNLSLIYAVSIQSGYGNIQSGGANLQSGYGNIQSGGGNTQSGYENIQSGNGNIQSDYSNTQSGSGNTQSGGGNSQSGASNTQSGGSNTQSGYSNIQSGGVNIQSGYSCTQSGNYGIQGGQNLNDGGFNYTVMFGTSKTATVGNRAYFALDNGIWIKPVAGDAASPENGVICYNATTHKFRGYANGVWVDLH